MRFHIHRWHTVREVNWATWSREYRPTGWPPAPPNPIPPSLAYGGVITGVALKECRCGGRRNDIIKGPHSPSNTWDRPGEMQ